MTITLTPEEVKTYEGALDKWWKARTELWLILYKENWPQHEHAIGVGARQWELLNPKPKLLPNL